MAANAAIVWTGGSADSSPGNQAQGILDDHEAGKLLPCWCEKWHSTEISIGELNKGVTHHDEVSAVQCALVVKQILFPVRVLWRTEKLPSYGHASFGRENFWLLHVKTGEGNTSHGNTPSLSNNQNSLGENHNVLDEMDIPCAGRQTLSRCLQLLPYQHAWKLSPVEQQKETYSSTDTWDHLWTLLQQSCLWKKTHLCLPRFKVPVQHGVFSIFYEERVRWFCKQISFGYRCLCASPAKQNKIKHSPGRTGGRKPTLRYYLHLKLNMCKAHLVMVPFRKLR